MPYSVSVNAPKNTITLVCWGEITTDDMIEYEHRFLEDQEHPGFHHIVDLQVAKFKFDRTRKPGEEDDALSLDSRPYKGARCALVVGDGEQHRVADAYRVMRLSGCNPIVREVSVFEDIDQAKAWVDASQVVRDPW